MSHCPSVCPREDQGAKAYSSPPVGNDEWVCRTVRPEDYTAKAAIKSSFIQGSQLRAGELSAWRAKDPSELPALDKKLKSKGMAYDNIIAIQAHTIRSIISDTGARQVSVINDTRIDDKGNHDGQHIALSPCAQLMAANDYDDHAAVVKTQLMLVFRNNEVALHPKPA